MKKAILILTLCTLAHPLYSQIAGRATGGAVRAAGPAGASPATAGGVSPAAAGIIGASGAGLGTPGVTTPGSISTPTATPGINPSAGINANVGQSQPGAANPSGGTSITIAPTTPPLPTVPGIGTNSPGFGAIVPTNGLPVTPLATNGVGAAPLNQSGSGSVTNDLSRPLNLWRRTNSAAGIPGSSLPLGTPATGRGTTRAPLAPPQSTTPR